ncbi:hypothetical protein FA95DRAFT_1538540 [Auriscalpium vulgare]|uniref:Uncharacterized protein n=1 Tax=Auriscalpium vulgare TaxID=40419 RepID=A0ACB8RYM3_9AGAM|nr:hypothetical protein FA95DRAFT_1538540 [Auriscalpium vulgare]
MSSKLRNLRQGYASLTPPQYMNFPTDQPFTDVQTFVLNSILLDGHLQRYPPSDFYQRSFWKWIISQLEALIGDEDYEVDERLYERQISLLSVTRRTQDLAGSSPPPPSYVTHFWENRSQGAPLEGLAEYGSVTLFESQTTIESGTTGLRTWRASFVLAQFLIDHPDTVRGHRVLELGSGAGFLGLVIACLQQQDGQGGRRSGLCLTDVNEVVLQRCAQNVNLPCNVSASLPHLDVRPLDWSDAVCPNLEPSTRKSLSGLDADTIVAADMLYHPDIITPFLTTLRLALLSESKLNTKTAYLALTVRNQELLDAFLHASTDIFHLCVEDISSRASGHQSSFLESERIDTENVMVIQVTADT